jgi:hypothetical protein
MMDNTTKEWITEQACEGGEWADPWEGMTIEERLSLVLTPVYLSSLNTSWPSSPSMVQPGGPRLSAAAEPGRIMAWARQALGQPHGDGIADVGNVVRLPTRSGAGTLKRTGNSVHAPSYYPHSSHCRDRSVGNGRGVRR